MNEPGEYALALGTNLGDRRQNLQKALDFLGTGAFKLGKVSGWYETPAWGFDSEHIFLNACVQVFTPLKPLEVLQAVKGFERDMGRLPLSKAGYTDRVIDIDILFYGDQIFELPELVIPHPQMHLRAFVLEPLKDIYPDWVHPVLGKSVAEMRSVVDY